jgi:hypothetical protein
VSRRRHAKARNDVEDRDKLAGRFRILDNDIGRSQDDASKAAFTRVHLNASRPMVGRA